MDSEHLKPSLRLRLARLEALPHIGLRYMIAFIYSITATIKPFLAKKGRSTDEVEKMYQAWLKSITLQATLWCFPYTKDNYF